MKIPNWGERTIFTANLLNPAFCGEVLRRTIVKYSKESGMVGLPFSLTFLILPILLHQDTRNLLPKTKRIKLHQWLTANDKLKIQLIPRIRYLVPYTRESIIFLYSHDVIDFSDKGEIIPLKTRNTNFSKESEEVQDILSTAISLGNWINTFPSEKITYTFFGIKP